jgi:hypothetical protein
MPEDIRVTSKDKRGMNVDEGDELSLSRRSQDQQHEPEYQSALQQSQNTCAKLQKVLQDLVKASEKKDGDLREALDELESSRKDSTMRFDAERQQLEETESVLRRLLEGVTQVSVPGEVESISSQLERVRSEATADVRVACYRRMMQRKLQHCCLLGWHWRMLMLYAERQQDFARKECWADLHALMRVRRRPADKTAEELAMQFSELRGWQVLLSCIMK